MEKLSDIALIARVTMLGDRRGFDRLVLKYQSQVRRFFINLTHGDAGLSDDLSQETFIKAYLNLKSFKATASFSTWLLRIGYNVFYDYLRSLKPECDLEEAAQDFSSSAPEREAENSLDLESALALLSQNERTCITLFYMEEQKIKDIASITGLKEGTIKSHLSRAKDKLSVYLKENGYGK